MADISTDETLRGDGGAREKWSLLPGASLGGYEVVKPLGRGGMGEVYLAENVVSRFRCALKVLAPSLAEDPTFRERFRREAAVLQRLRHNSIVTVHHPGEEDGYFFLTMDYVEGRTLDDALKERGRLTGEETAWIALQIGEALSYVHGHGVIHRDIKPANVLLDAEGHAKLSDFGLARVVGDEFIRSMTERSISLSTARTGGQVPLTEGDHAIIGTYEYMSPEQKAGESADERSDIFSLGLVIYRMLTGERAEGRFPRPSKLGCYLIWDGIVDKCLATKPEERYASADDLAAALRKADEAERRRREREAGRRARQAELRRLREEEEAGRGLRRTVAVLGGILVAAVLTGAAASAVWAFPEGHLQQYLVYSERNRQEAAEAEGRADEDRAGGVEALRRRQGDETAMKAGEEGGTGGPLRPREEEAAREAAREQEAEELRRRQAEEAARKADEERKAEERRRQQAEEEMRRGAKVLSGHSNSVISVAFSPQGRYLATGSNDRTLRLWSVPEGTLVARLSRPEVPVYSVTFSPDGRHLATRSGDRTVRLWSVPEGSLAAMLSAHSFRVTSVVFSPDGRHLATGGWDDTARLWSVADGSRVATLSGHSDVVYSVAFSPDGRHLATCSEDETARLWSVPEGTLVARLSGHEGPAYSVAFSPDGRHLATRGGDRAVRLWSVPQGSLVATLSGHWGAVYCFAFSPDGRFLATGGRDDTARLWSVPDGSLVAALSRHSGGVRFVAFGPDARYLATHGSQDKAVCLWSVPGGSFVARLSGHSDELTSVAFSPDGRHLVLRQRCICG